MCEHTNFGVLPRELPCRFDDVLPLEGRFVRDGVVRSSTLDLPNE